MFASDSTFLRTISGRTRLFGVFELVELRCVYEGPEESVASGVVGVFKQDGRFRLLCFPRLCQASVFGVFKLVGLPCLLVERKKSAVSGVFGSVKQ